MKIKAFLSFAKISMKMQVMYQPIFWSAFFGNIIWLIITYSFWLSAYESPNQFGISLNQMMTYSVLAMMLHRYMRGVGGIMSVIIRDGSIAVELMRPYHVMMKFFALDLGSKAIVFLRETTPMFLIIICFVPFQFASIQNTLFFLISALLGIYLGMIWDLIIDLFSFWLINMWGVYLLYGSLVSLLSGAMIPLNFFPEWFSSIKDYLPFPSMIYVPTSIYTGELTGDLLYRALYSQIGWILGSMMVLMIFWNFAVKRLNVHGG